ncbi:glycoside hydrolase family 88 protein [Paenibacillus dokdonensis]|uniref:Glycoside hydrolase family 88 protein n=1 Tax=Paenibacillus dokdonensis TaxID=2567944 RepID=A0ABU6GNX7_9BACL|nr:glycoside hydrolase family 88 protein [Paenibacillus dokdonensis]MEC0241138.1 glycoside hydrolase family 88 protein [Paenibacillus dokdonensis]
MSEQTLNQAAAKAPEHAELSTSVHSWADGLWERIGQKIERTSRRIGVSCPHASVNGVYDDMRISWWTAGFWPGILWQLSADGKYPELKSIAEQCEERLDEPLHSLAVHHDSGFIWLLSAVANYRITGNERSKERGLMAASQLASRFNLKGRYIRAWHDTASLNRAGWSIIDTMMNLPLLYWASETTKDPRFRHIAAAHAETVLTHFMRPDGSSYHILHFDAETGELLGADAGQGHAENSAWARGSGWTIYGMVLSYQYTGDEAFLIGAKRAAHFFLANLPEDYVPHWDFRAPRNADTPRDTSAGACAACGLIELAGCLPAGEGQMYLEAAVRLVRSMDENYGAWDREDEEGLILSGTSNLPGGVHVDTPLIYGDYFFVEAVSKLRGSERRFW